MHRYNCFTGVLEMSYSSKQLTGMDHTENDPIRRRGRNKKGNPEESLNNGTRVIKYSQTKQQRTMYQTIYMVFSILSFLLSVLVYFLSDMTDSITGLITIWDAMVVGLAHVYRSTSQLVIKDSMTEAMYRVAVKNFQIVNIVYAIIMTAAAVITIILTTTNTSPSNRIICFIAIILSAILAWVMPILEKSRKLEACWEEDRNFKEFH